MKLHVRAWGDEAAPAIVLVHGVTAHGGRFARLAREPALAGYRLIAVDLRGHGHSSWEPPWNLDQHLEDLLETAAGARLWVGHSFGGRLVLELAAARPDRVERAVLLDPALWVPPPIALERAEGLRRPVVFESVEDAVDRWIGSGRDPAAPREALEEDFAAHLEPAAGGGLQFRFCRSAAIAAYGEMARTPPLERLEVPVRVVRATGSEVCPVELVEALAEGLGSGLTVTEVPGGHTPMWDAPAEAAALVAGFMAQ